MKQKDTFSEELKSKLIATAKEHQDADMFVQGKRLQEGGSKEEMHRGCFFGCMLQKDEDVLESASVEMQLPEWLVHVAEKIFEGLPKEDAVLWPLQLLESIPANTDITKHRKRFNYIMLMDKDKGQISFVQDKPELLKVIEDCANLYLQDIISESAAESAARSAESAAWSAAESAARSAESAAWSAAWSARSAAESAAWSAWSAARSAAESAAWSAWSAAWSAAESARPDESAAEKDHYKWLRDTLLFCLREE